MCGIIYVLIIIVIFFGDLWIKNRIERYIPAKGEKLQERELLGGGLLIRRHRNRGALLNMGEKKRALVAVVSVAMTALTLFVFLLSLGNKGNKLLRMGLSLLLGGAFSNTYDRLKRKYVVDYLSFNVRWKKLRGIVFNVSDFCIIIGALLAVLGDVESVLKP